MVERVSHAAAEFCILFGGYFWGKVAQSQRLEDSRVRKSSSGCRHGKLSCPAVYFSMLPVQKDREGFSQYVLVLISS